MRALLLKYWDRLRSSFWFLPALMAAGAVALALATVRIDEGVTGDLPAALGWAYSGGAEGASAVLSTIAGSMTTIAGVVFSMTLVALSLASSQFGPRLLRNFMRDTTNQVVLGTFVATFLYCLLVLRTILRGGDGDFVPHLSVTLAVVFAAVSLWVLIYFIHHVSVSIQADEIVARVGTELASGIDTLFPERLGEGVPAGDDAPETSLPAGFEQESTAIPAQGDGYLQFLDAEALMTLAEAEDLVFRVERRPGHYVIAGRGLVRAWPAERVTDDLRTRVNAAFVLGSQRTPGQDLEFEINQLVEIAVRALSPGVNDPFTAVTCIDRLGSALCRLAARDMPSPRRRDRQGRLRVVAPAVTFAAITDAAFNQIRQYSRSSAAVTVRLLETIAVVAEVATRPADREALRRHAMMVARGAREGLPDEDDRRAVDARHRDVTRALEGAAGPLPA
ncbi:MAG: DUF2254 domain-containing protein [Vicinamibacterales bacterium]